MLALTGPFEKEIYIFINYLVEEWFDAESY
jgi:hypothetical protein